MRRFFIVIKGHSEDMALRFGILMFEERDTLPSYSGE